MEWQPIETAPRDGVIVDLWCDGIRFADCAWKNTGARTPFKKYERHEYDPPGWCFFSEEWGWIPFDVKPTHWMPLPEPPK